VIQSSIKTEEVFLNFRRNKAVTRAMNDLLGGFANFEIKKADSFAHYIF